MPIPPKIGVLIPAYCEEATIGKVISGVKRHLGLVLIVDDGSSDETAVRSKAAGAEVIVHEQNRGKGASVKTGLRTLELRGVDYFLVMDSDGQHDPEDIPKFVAAASDASVAVFCGNRMGDLTTMPLVRKITNKFMSWRISRACQQRIPDSQCGFRMYRRDTLAHLLCETNNFDYETETLLLIARHGLKIGAVPVRTIYGDEKSKIRPVRDTIRFFQLMRRYRR
ncbi:MAG TPA: glycosyltransferase family 2 protein [Chthoniobacterales bacterium]